MLSALRIRQWLKNVLIFVPAITSHRIVDVHVLVRVCLAFLSFSLCASTGYIINDLLDRQADRQHPVNRRRPFASGALSVRSGIVEATVIATCSAAIAIMVSPQYALMLAGYLILSVAYSAAFKTVLMLDVFVLAFFYTFRVWLGGEAAAVAISFWLAAFSTFFFFSLAIMKRFIELRLCEAGKRSHTRRDYRAEDLAMLGIWGPASGCAAVVVLALYINAGDVVPLYSHPTYLWPVCLAVLFWISRIWMLANRNEIPHDPIIFAATDRTSYIIGALVAIALYLAV